LTPPHCLLEVSSSQKCYFVAAWLVEVLLPTAATPPPTMQQQNKEMEIL